MEKYKAYELEEFLLDEDFKVWVASGASLPNSFWEKLLTTFPEKSGIFHEAVSILRDWKKLPSNITDTEVAENIQSILNAVRAEQPLLPTIWLWKKWMAYAALFLLALGSLFYFTKSNPNTGQIAQQQNQIEISNQTSLLKVFELPDGSKINLYPGSKITYSKQFDTSPIRAVALVGEAFFKIKRDTIKPFTVSSGDIVTSVLGTSFTIRNWPDEISVSVTTGKVSVFKSDQQNENVILTTNQKAIYNTHAQTLEKGLVDNPVLIKKETSNHAFNDESAIHILKSLEADYGIPIHFKEQELKNCYVTIPFQDEPFYQKLDILCRTINASYRTVQNEVIIESKGCEKINF